MRRLIFVALTFSASLCTSLNAQNLSSESVAALARMARAKSVGALTRAKEIAGSTYRARVVFSARRLELEPNSKQAAESLFDLIPKTEEEQRIFMTLGDSLCDGESFRDMNSLDRLGERLPRDLAQAVLLVPSRMLKYVTYGWVSADDPHSDYLVQMETVCRTQHLLFVSAVRQLGNGTSPADGGFAAPSATWFRTKLFDPDKCHALELPEAE